MEKAVEVIRMKQEIKEVEEAFPLIHGPEDAAKIATTYIGDEDREVVLVMVLNTKNEINAIHRCHIGAINQSIVHPREVFKAAILNNGASVIMAHNHPSGHIEPSMEDVNITNRIVEAGKVMGIEVLDHVIVNSNGSTASLKEKGYV